MTLKLLGEGKITDRKAKCPDCIECQMCSKSRCRICQKGTHGKSPSALPTGFSHGQYLEWKKKRQAQEF